MDFFEVGSPNYLSRLALNRDPPDLCLLSSWDYRCEPPALGCFLVFDSGVPNPIDSLILFFNGTGV
jgi:hypothetical protein